MVGREAVGGVTRPAVVVVRSAGVRCVVALGTVCDDVQKAIFKRRRRFWMRPVHAVSDKPAASLVSPVGVGDVLP